MYDNVCQTLYSHVLIFINCSLYPAILNGGVLCYHYVSGGRMRAGGRMASTSLTTFILDTI